MTAERKKAEELVEKFGAHETNFSSDGGYTFNKLGRRDSIDLALIAVDEILNNCVWTKEQYKRLFKFDESAVAKESTTEFWQGVKNELQQL